MFSRARNQFTANVRRVRDLGGLHASLINNTTPAIDLSDILRAQLVLIVSALDTLIHEVVREGVLAIVDGYRLPTPAFQKLEIRVPTRVLSASELRDLFDAEIRRKHAFLSFQSPDKVADALRIVTNVKLWDAVSTKLGEQPSVVKERLRLLVERRNKIAHEADEDPTNPGVRWPISANDVDGAVDYISRFGEAILDCI